MPEYQINPPIINEILGAFGLNKVKYKIIKSVHEDLQQLGIRPIATVASQLALEQIYKPGISSKAREYEASLTQKNNDELKSGYNDFIAPPSLTAGGNTSEFVFSSLKFSDTIDYASGSRNKLTMIDNFIPACLFSVNTTKNIVKTNVLGRNTSVKEYISDGDYIINCKCIITGSNGIYPLDKVNNLISFLKQPTHLEIISPYLNKILGITYVVVDSFDMVQTEGGISQQGFNINLTSDIPFFIGDIKLKEQSNETIGGVPSN